jgi:hypothetical protein
MWSVASLIGRVNVCLRRTLDITQLFSIRSREAARPGNSGLDEINVSLCAVFL